MAERVADGVEVLRLRPPTRLQRLTNVYLLDDGGGVTLFDSGSVSMAAAIRRAGAAHLVLRTDRDWIRDIVGFVLSNRQRRGGFATPAGPAGPGVAR